ncbi:tetraspanin-9-like [Mya arenaria]|uniref:tetraspanin-9-like n=1 Tax=Mya arenaria TaxID=6604 RepID=UPI0022E8DA9E|nr:tetraspanin-9-like [Mya arenaria]
MGCFQSLGRLLLIVINIIFFLLGLTLIIVGFILRFGESIYGPMLEVGMAKLQLALSDTSMANFDVGSIQLGEVMVGLSAGVIIGGLILAALAMFGWCGACYRMKCFLYIYALVICIFVLAEALTIGILYGKPDVVKDPVKSQMSDFKGLSSSEVYTLAWNIVMIQYKCCGVDAYTDFTSTGAWTTAAAGVTLVTPIACCKDLPTGNSVSDFDCATSYNATLSNGMTGCFDTIWDLSFGKTLYAVPVLVCCAIIQLMFVIFAIIVGKSSEQNEKVRPL